MGGTAMIVAASEKVTVNSGTWIVYKSYTGSQEYSTSTLIPAYGSCEQYGSCWLIYFSL